MKFTESLSSALVPEWKSQYLEYKKGKKLIKKVKFATETQASDTTPLLQPQKSSDYSHFKSTGPNNTNTDTNTYTGPNPDAGQSSHLRDSQSQAQTQASTSASSRPAVQFYKYLDEEYAKVEAFYKNKEQDVYERFLILEDQLYQLKEHRAHSLHQKRAHKSQSPSEATPAMYSRVNELAYHTKSAFGSLARYDLPSLPSTAFLKKFRRKSPGDITMTKSDVSEIDVNYFENRIRNGLNAGSGDPSDSDSDQEDAPSDFAPAAAPPTAAQMQAARQRAPTSRQDYVPKKRFPVPFLFARKQLKEAILEYYRSLVLLRSYKELNRTAFRKITKKFDKITGSAISAQYMNKLDTESYFLTSTILDQLTFQMEELYITFFDPNSTDRKQALEKLKSIAYALNSDQKSKSFYWESFTSGLAIGFGVPLFVLALYTALRRIFNGDFPEGTFLLQIFGGFFLLTVLFLFLGFDFFIFEKFNINYKFIFELNIATALDSRQFLLVPATAFALLALLMWFSMNDFWPDQFPGRDWPWIYFGIGLGIFLWPFDHFYLSARRWLQVALWRLMLSGFYPVEIRDFFLGDLLCSLTYTMGNISFFFCLYSHHWNGVLGDIPSKTGGSCGSSKSRSMGFFAALPSIWRCLQCMRRFADTGDSFPHLANMFKYAIGATYYCLLSVWRIDRSTTNKIAFIVFACINSIYTATWDVIMDWSLLQFGSKNWLLRDNLFFVHPAYYYVAVVIDVVFRFQWIFYVFFSNQIQQSAATSFLIALAELIRRIIWVLFRLENEHATNVILFRASKDSPLPYAVSYKVEKAIKKLVSMKYKDENLTSMVSFTDTESIPEQRVTGAASTATARYPESIDSEALERGTRASGTSMASVVRKRSILANVSDALTKAHIKDFQRRKKMAIEEDSDDESLKSERSFKD